MSSQQLTTFGQILDSDIAKKIVINVIDMLLGGAPSTVILNDVRRRWEVDAQLASDLIDAIDSELNQMADSSLSRTDKINEIFSKLGGANPVGLIYQRLNLRLKKLERANKADTARAKELNEQRKNQVNKISQLSTMMSKDLGSWIVDSPKELYHEVVKGD